MSPPDWLMEPVEPDFGIPAEMEEHARDEELAGVLCLLRSEESQHLRCSRPRHAEYVHELIERLERGEHRR